MTALEPISVTELMHFLERDVTESRGAEIRERLTHCTVTQQRLKEAQQILNGLRTPDPALETLDLVADVHRALARPVVLSWRQRVMSHAAPLLAAAALVLGVAVYQARFSSEGFAVKGGTSESPLDPWVGISVFSVRDDGGTEPVVSDIRQDARLLFAYTNLGPQPAGHLMVLGVDSEGQVYWYYPAHDGAVSIPVVSSISRQELPDAIQHPLPLGRLAVYALFSRTPLRTVDVEQELRRLVALKQWDIARPARLVPSAAQSMLVLNVIP